MVSFCPFVPGLQKYDPLIQVMHNHRFDGGAEQAGENFRCGALHHHAAASRTGRIVPGVHDAGVGGVRLPSWPVFVREGGEWLDRGSALPVANLLAHPRGRLAPADQGPLREARRVERCVVAVLGQVVVGDHGVAYQMQAA